ncbi:DUF2970 domain-containing protein [Shewanella schlegeliana]|uniref:DUF2970 domain-containing protein n=1 Tax=Shewanella schlegeliana TaxID=190308 RepID=A0ABS1T2N5_9GAMM|nr:DUF2970 domain-containing protein [Shewanella schlegeliana]MBL4915052.1 DUF2970 domain-containing protein [Shewanella schlegeliana]MCL1110536.1 DUF2970 domain-containing protein [Shewanella schlegeliana]GIU32414.1 DUF2970 domain-containing protein [Shewanella schlegeliana]
MLRRFWQILSSTLAAFFGVQTEQNRIRDFQTTSPIAFIIMGIVLAILFVVALLLIVNQVLT